MPMAGEEHSDLIERTPPGQLWISRNYPRLRLLCGVALVAVAAWGLSTASVFSTVLAGVFGCWLLGGWPAVRRLVRHPRAQLKHWYYVLIDARQYAHRHVDDGSVEVTAMRPTLHKGWHWRSLRWYEHD